MAWFFRCYEAKETGWWPARYPDGLPLSDQDNYFLRCLETIAQELNLMRIEEMKRPTK